MDYCNCGLCVGVSLHRVGQKTKKMEMPAVSRVLPVLVEGNVHSSMRQLRITQSLISLVLGNWLLTNSQFPTIPFEQSRSRGGRYA